MIDTHLDASTLGPHSAIHDNVEATKYVKGLQVRAVVKDGSHCLVVQFTARNLEGAQPVHCCDTIGFVMAELAVCCEIFVSYKLL